MYQVLARKYRPRNFSQLVGQTHVAKALSSALERGRLHHAYLFTGTRGVGKTTIARILAKCLNCETGVTATPCESCAVCTAVNEGRFIDLIEIDAASRTGVDDTRELLNNVPYAPTQGRYKVYLIDEVHMFSNSSFNALLKTLEEPPEHVKFLFATTDPQKLPITVISRCLQFTLRPLAKDEIYQQLDYVLLQENIPHEAEALWQLAESAQGSVRDALSLTDQAIAYGEGQVLAQDVKDMLGLIDKGLVLDLILNIHQNQRQAIAQLLTNMRQQALDVTHVLEQMIAALHEMALLQCLGVVAHDQEDFEQRKAQIAQLINAQDLQLYYQIAIQGRADLSLALTPEQGFEMCVMRLLAFRPLATHEVTVQATQTILHAEAQPQITQISKPEPSSVENSAGQQEIVEQHAVSAKPNVQHDNVENEAEKATLTEQTTFAAEPELGQSQIEITQQTTEQQVQTHVETTEAASTTLLTSQENLDTLASAQTVEDSSSVTIENTQTIPQADLLTSDDEQVINPQSEENHAIDDQESAQQFTEALNQENIQNLNHLNFAEQDSKNQNGQNPNLNVSVSDLLPIIDDPRQLLQPAQQTLLGEWTLEKWDYWLRQDRLSPAIKEIAQHGIMQGKIEGASILMLDPSYQRMFEGFIHEVENALQGLNENLKLNVQYQTIQQKNPFTLQQERKRQAYQAAQQKLAQHPAVEQLIQEFSANIEEFQLKN